MENAFNLVSALEASRRGQISEWVQHYLRSGVWANHVLADGLLLSPRWWLGPFEAPLGYFTRKCGPEPEMEYKESIQQWQSRVTAIASSISNLESMPPLIAEWRGGKWLIADGNHRHAAWLRRGFKSCWALVWLNSEEEFNQAKASIFASGRALHCNTNF